MNEHAEVDIDLLADYIGGALDGADEAEVARLIAEDPRISILILAASAASGGPGPLITALTSRYASRLTVPLTIVPGNMDDDALERVT